MFDIRKPLALAAAIVMSLSFTACGSKDDDDDDDKDVKKYSSAVDLMKDVNDHIDGKGYAIKMEMTMNIKMKNGEQAMDMKMVEHEEGTTDGEYSHSTTQESVSYEQYPDMNSNESSEEYKQKIGDKMDTYTSEDGGSTWTYSSEDDDDDLLGTDANNFKNADLKTTSKGYEISGKVSELGDSNPFAEENESLNSFGITDMNYVLTINSDLEPVSIVVEKMDFESPKEYAEETLGEGGTITGDLELAVRYSDWGKIKSGDITIPEEALKAKG